MLPKKYDPKSIEDKWKKMWEEMGIYKFNPDSDKPVFSIDTPPRYASGYLHMGHAKNYIEFEIIARFMRMIGYNVFLPNGYDDNGLPTEKYVEEKLGMNKKDVDRKTFIDKCKWAAERLEERMTKTFKDIGFSCDWSTLYRTISDYAVKMAQMSFIELYKKGEIYRKEEPTLWCPHHQTALAQAEVVDLPRKTKLNYILFELEDGKKIEIATTRPELLPSCVGIFVNPDDDRYKDLVGKKAIVPIFGQKVPIMADKKVDKEFGSGIVMICTFGDTTDIEWWREYNLPMKISINKDGTMNELAGKYEGLKIEDAKKKIIEDLKESGLLIKQEDLEQTVGCCWRCETPIEFIPTKQWFIKTLEHKDKMIELGRKINWRPEYYRKRYEDWVRNLKWDWCISRQRYFGVPFPLWYRKDTGEVVLAKEEDLPVDPRIQRCPYDNGDSECIPEMDVMDTWMTSSLTPQIVSKWKIDDKFFNKIFPMSLRPQAHDIIRTWAFYTILKSYLHNNSIPWKDIMISGYVYVDKGLAMSSSKGIGDDPEKIVERDGADALRYWTTEASLGEDLIYREKDIIRGKKILIKLWNASRFVEMHLKDYKPKEVKLRVTDKWILNEMYKAAEESKEAFKNYNPNKARKVIEIFFKNIFCDFYLEMVKHRLYNDVEKESAQYTLYNGLLGILKMYAPIIPFITEEIYQNMFKENEKDKSIHTSRWPETGEIDEEVIEIGRLGVSIITYLRQHKTKNNLPLNQELNEIVIECDKETEKKIKLIEDDIKWTMKIKEIKFEKTKNGIGIGSLKIEVRE
ncbi:MAG: valine--tRNA ligase [Candidatus Aenigmarchaeota archaeon]|nr:valine--tRNA ligase [Candidatus Aenigmarchaeota archaeon]